MEAANPSVFGIQMWCLVRLAYPDVMTEFFTLTGSQSGYFGRTAVGQSYGVVPLDKPCISSTNSGMQCD